MMALTDAPPRNPGNNEQNFDKVNSLKPEPIPYVNWDDFNFRWSQGEHVAMIGPTGQGKSTLALELLPMRKYVVVFATKPQDSTLRGLKGFTTISKWESMHPQLYPKRILWPDATKLYSDSSQREVFKSAFEKIYGEGGWCVLCDETWYLNNHLKLSREIRTYLLQARSLNISLILLAQRPSWIPLEVFDQATHLFFFRDNDRRNLDKIGGIGYLDSRLIRDTVARLKQHEFLYINSRNGEMVVSKLQLEG